jgi:ATP-binding cassette subfamily F protein uup
VVTSTLVFEGAGQINEYVGGYSDWLRQRKVAATAGAAAASAATASAAAASGNAASASAASTGAASAGAATLKASAPQLAATVAPKPKRLSYNEQRELAQLPERIQRLEAEQAQLNARISDPTAFQRNKDDGNIALQRLQALAAELETAYSRWDTLESSARPETRA